MFSEIWEEKKKRGKKKKKTCFQVQLLAAIRFAYFSAWMLTRFRWSPKLRSIGARRTSQIQCTWKNLENYYKHLWASPTNKWATTRKILHKIWGVFYLPFSFNVRKSKNLETSISVLFFFFLVSWLAKFRQKSRFKIKNLKLKSFWRPFKN